MNYFRVFFSTQCELFQWQSSSYSAVVLFLSWQISCSLAFIFLVCNLGHRIGKAFDQIDSTISKLQWFKFSIEINRMLPILIIGAQQPVELHVFGSASCTYENFQTASPSNPKFKCSNENFQKISHSLHTYVL